MLHVVACSTGSMAPIGSARASARSISLVGVIPPIPRTTFSPGLIHFALNHLFIHGSGRSRPWHFLGKNAEVPSSEGITDDAFAVLTLCVESGVWWRPSNEWISRTAWYRVVCPGPFFCGFTRGMKQGEYLEIDGQLAIHHYASLNFTNPVYEIHATQIRRLEIPVVGVIEKYDG